MRITIGLRMSISRAKEDLFYPKIPSHYIHGVCQDATTRVSLSGRIRLGNTLERSSKSLLSI
jgi:hypothetical protein